MAALREQRTKLQVEYQDLLRIYKPAFPKMQQLQAAIDEIEKKIQEESDIVRRSIEGALQRGGAAGRERPGQARVGQEGRARPAGPQHPLQHPEARSRDQPLALRRPAAAAEGSRRAGRRRHQQRDGRRLGAGAGLARQAEPRRWPAARRAARRGARHRARVLPRVPRRHDAAAGGHGAGGAPAGAGRDPAGEAREGTARRRAGDAVAPRRALRLRRGLPLGADRAAVLDARGRAAAVRRHQHDGEGGQVDVGAGARDQLRAGGPVGAAHRRGPAQPVAAHAARHRQQPRGCRISCRATCRRWASCARRQCRTST